MKARDLVAVLVPGGVLALAWWKRSEIMSGIGWVVRSAYAGNFGGARTVPVDQVVIHTTEASAESALAWFAMPHGAAGPTSAHYVIGRDGAVYQVVPEDRIAWHAGDRVVNGRSIGIECEGRAADPATWTPALVDGLGRLLGDISRRHGVPAERAADDRSPGILGHSEVRAAAALRTDPGPWFPWGDVLSKAAAAGGWVA